MALPATPPAAVSATMTGRCGCGAVTLTLPDLPAPINACPCDSCCRVGAHWGFLFQDAPGIEGRTETDLRAARSIEFHHCAALGITTHWQFSNRPAGTCAGFDMTNFDPALSAAIPVVVDP